MLCVPSTKENGQTPLAPILKWPGGKRSLLPQIIPLIDLDYTRLVEPFCGGAALFFYLRPTSALLCDANDELINVYVQIRDNIGELICRLKRLHNTEEAYYEVRAKKCRTELTRATRILYLMRLSFNGIYRENLRGEFNVPYGHKTSLSVCDETRLRQSSSALQGVDLIAQDFTVTMDSVEDSDLVYVDPPYSVQHNNNGFIKYNQTLFVWDDQIRLAEMCESARKHGATVVVSNADHGQIRSLYPRFEYHQVKRYTPISGNPHGRGHITEAVLIGRKS